MPLLAEDMTAYQSAPVNAIYLMVDPSTGDSYWLSFPQSAVGAYATNIDLSLGSVPGDTTVRTFITGLAEGPAYTNLALAIVTQPYPTNVARLGVPAPVATPEAEITAVSNGTTVTDSWATLSSWTLTPFYNVPGTTTRFVDLYSANIVNIESYNSLKAAYLYRDFGIGNAATVECSVEFSFYYDDNAFWNVFCSLGCNQNGEGPRVGIVHNYDGLRSETWTTEIVFGTGATWSDIGSFTTVETISSGNPNADAPIAPSFAGPNVYKYLFQMLMNKNENGSATVNVKVFGPNSSTTLVCQATGTVPITSGGDYVGFYNYLDDTIEFGGGVLTTWLQNFSISSSGFYVDESLATATNYVETYVNNLGQESAPGAVSNTVIRDDGTQVTVSIDDDAPSGYPIDYVNLYRAVTNNAGTQYQFVAQIPYGTTTYNDTIPDADLGEVLQSTIWDTPPSNLQGILALPNGIMAGFFDNVLCLSVQNEPHAWPVDYQLTTDYPIVGIGAIDSTVVILTKSFPYLATGSDPSVFSMARLEIPEGCVAKRSIGYIKGYGIIYASGNGLIAVSGSGGVRNLTEQMYSRKEWKALNPSSMIASTNDGKYYVTYTTTGGAKGSLILDSDLNGFGIAQLDFHWTACFTDLEADIFYFVPDYTNMPTDSGPAPPTDMITNGKVIYAWDQDPNNLRNYSWTSKLYQLERPAYFNACQVKALDYTDLWIELQTNGTVYFTTQVTSAQEFVLPVPEVSSVDDIPVTFQFRIFGRSQVSVIQFSEDMEELQ